MKRRGPTRVEPTGPPREGKRRALRLSDRRDPIQKGVNFLLGVRKGGSSIAYAKHNTLYVYRFC